MGEMRMDMGPGEISRICAKFVKPGSKVGVAVGCGVRATGGWVGRGVSVAVGTMALAVAKAACPVEAMTVEMWLGGRGVALGSNHADCEQADKNSRAVAVIRIFGFMVVLNQYPAGFKRAALLKTLRDDLITVRKFRCIFGLNIVCMRQNQFWSLLPFVPNLVGHTCGHKCVFFRAASPAVH